MESKLKTFADLEFHPHAIHPDGIQAKMDFDNGYGISVIRTPFSYGYENGLYECVVLKEGRLCYDTDITNDVIGHCTTEKVSEIMSRIQNLKTDEK